MRTIGVVTVGRSDLGIYLPVLKRILADPELKLYLMVTGMHLAPEFGRTVQLIETSGIPIAEKIEMLLSSDSPEGTGKSMGLGVMGFAQSFGRQRPDLLVVLGDRFEMLPAALAALPFKIPVAHIHGGEVTEGAIDDSLRHCITKLSHLHFVSTNEYGRRIRQLGEEPWRITVSGAPSLDNLTIFKRISRTELQTALGFPLEDLSLLVTFHPVTLDSEEPASQLAEVMAALDSAGLPTVFTLPNADTGGRRLAQDIREYVAGHPNSHLVENLGSQLYFGLMNHVSAMVGNSSSGIIEAPSFSLPVVNVGRRQGGRVRGANVIDIEGGTANILAAIRRAVSSEFRSSIKNKPNPYFGGKDAAELIVDKLRTVELNQRLIAKRFQDYLPSPCGQANS